MKLSRLPIVCFIVAALSLVATESVAHADVPVSTVPNASSCVWAFAGQEASFSWALSATQTLKIKCYFDPAGAPAGFGGWWDTAYTPGTATNCLGLGYTASSGAEQTLRPDMTASHKYRADTVTRVQYAPGYVEFALVITKYGGSAQTWDRTSNNRWVLDPNCDGAGTDRKILGCATIGGTANCDGVTRVADSVYNTTAPAKRWGAEFSLFQFCGAEVVAYNSLGTPLTATSEIKNGDRLEIRTTWTSGRTGEVVIQWPAYAGTNEDLHTGYVDEAIYTPGGIANPSVRMVTVKLPAAYANVRYTLGRLNLRCRDEVLATSFFLKFGSPVAEAGDGRARPCSTARMYWPSNRNINAGQTETWSLNYSGTPTAGLASYAITVEWATFDESLGSTPPMSSLTWTAAASSVALGYNGDLTATAGYTGTLQQFVWRCTDAVGTLYGGQWSTSLRLRDADSIGENPSDCLGQTGIGLAPSSWIPGLWRMGTCVLTLSFVPSEQFLNGTFSDDLDEGTFDDTSVFYPLTLASSLITTGADVLIVTDGEIAGGGCGFAMPWSPINSTGTGPGGSSVEVIGMSSSALSFNMCSDSGMRTVVQAVRYLGLVGSVFGFILWAYRWASRLSMGNGEK